MVDASEIRPALPAVRAGKPVSEALLNDKVRVHMLRLHSSPPMDPALRAMLTIPVGSRGLQLHRSLVHRPRFWRGVFRSAFQAEGVSRVDWTWIWCRKSMGGS